MKTAFTISVVLFILAALYRGNEVCPTYSSEKLKYIVAAVDTIAFFLFLAGVWLSTNLLILALISLSFLVGAYWLVGGQIWK